MRLLGCAGQSLKVLVGAGAMLLLLAVSSPLAAQTTNPNAGSGFPGFSGSPNDQVRPRLVLGSKGGMLRLSQVKGDEQAGGGAITLEAASGDNWQKLVELRSPEKGVTLRDPELAVSPSNELALVYRWWRNSPRAKQLRLARSDDGGKTWSRSEQPIDSSGQVFDPSAAWGVGKTLVVVWADERRGGKAFDVYARRSPDGGATWGPEQLLSEFPEKVPSDAFARPRLLSDGQDRYWAVWMGLRHGRSSLYMNRSVDGGRKWTDPVPLTGESQSVFGHSLQRAGDRMLLVWHDTRTGRDRLYAVTSSDAGATWTAPTRVDHLPESSEVAATSSTMLLNADGEALVAWQDARNGRDDIFLARSTDGGRTWGGEDQRMDADEPGTALSRFPSLARAKDGRVVLAWDDDRAGLENVYVRVRSTGARPQWGPETRVSSPAPKLAARLPQVRWAADGALYVAWEVWDHTTGASNLAKRIDTKILRFDNR
jgi:BNR repeat-like domain